MKRSRIAARASCCCGYAAPGRYRVSMAWSSARMPVESQSLRGVCCAASGSKMTACGGVVLGESKEGKKSERGREIMARQDEEKRIDDREDRMSAESPSLGWF